MNILIGTEGQLDVISDSRVILPPYCNISNRYLPPGNSPNAQGTNNGYFYQFCICNAKITLASKCIRLTPKLRG